MNKNIGKNISKNVRSIYSLGVSTTGQKLFDYVKKSTTNVLKITSKRAIHKTAEATGYLIGNKIANKIIKISKTSPHNSSDTVTNKTKKKLKKIKN